MSEQFVIFLLLFGGIQGLLLVWFFLQKKLFQNGYVFLLLFLGALLLQLTLKVMNKLWLMQNWPDLYSFAHYLPLLYGPLVYLFVKNILPGGKVRSKDILHFIPALLIILLNTLYTPALYQKIHTAYLVFNPHIRVMLLATSLFTYHILSFRLLKQKVGLAQTSFFNSTFPFNWIRHFIYVSLVTCLVIIAALYLLYINFPQGHEYRYGFVIISVCIYWFSYTALTRPSVFSIIRGVETQVVKTDLSLPAFKVLKQSSKYANSALNDEDAQQIVDNLKRLMTDQKLYLQSELTISQLAESLHCTRHHLSQVLNDKLKLSYYDYINSMRIEEAKSMLQDEKNLQLKIAAVAYDVGFNSLSTFNEVFRKQTGKTPSAFRKDSFMNYQKQRV